MIMYSVNSNDIRFNPLMHNLGTLRIKGLALKFIEKR